MCRKHTFRHLDVADVVTCYLFCIFCMIHDYYILIIKEMYVNQVASVYPTEGMFSEKPVIPQNSGSEKRTKGGTRQTKLLAPRISRRHFFLAA